MSDDYFVGGKVPPPVGVGSVHIGYNSGWSCPKCGAVMSPTTPICLYCAPKKTTTQENTSNSGGPQCLTE